MATQETILKLKIETGEVANDTAELMKSVEVLTTELNELKKAYKEGAIEAEQVAIKTGQLSAAKQELRAQQRVLTAAINSESDSYNQLSAQYSKNKLAINKISESNRELSESDKQLVKDTDAIYQKMKLLQEATGKHQLSVGNYEIATKSLRQETRELTAAIVQAKLAGTENSDEMQKMKIRLGELKDAMGDAAMEAKTLGSDTRNIDMAVGVFTAVGNAAQGAQAAYQLFGGESESVERGIQKMMASQVILNSVQEVATALQKESAAMLALNTAKQKIAVTWQNIYTSAVGTSTGAMKGFRIALLSTGIGALVIGIGLLIANWNKLSEAINTSKKETENLNKQVGNLNLIAGIKNKLIQDEIDLLKSKGATDDEIIKKEKQLLESEVARTTNIVSAYELIISKKEEELKLTNEKIKQISTQDNLLTQSEAFEIQAHAGRVDRLTQEIAINKVAMNADAKAKTEAERQLTLFIEGENTKRRDIDKKNKEDSKKLSEQENEEIKQAIKEMNLEILEDIKNTKEEKHALKLASNEAERAAIQEMTDYEKGVRAKNNEDADLLLQQEIDKAKERDSLNRENEILSASEWTGEKHRLLLEDLEYKYQSELQYAEKIGADKILIEKKYQLIKNELQTEAMTAALGVASDTFSALEGLAEEGSIAQKGLAIASTTIDTIVGAQAAYKAVIGTPFIGPVLAPIAAGAAIVAGMARVKKIMSINPKTGGGGGAGGGDSKGTAPANKTITAPQLQAGGVNSGIISRQTITGNQQQPQSTVAVVVDDVTKAQSSQTMKNKASIL